MALGGFAALLVCSLCYTLLCRRPRDTSRMSEEVSRGTRSRDYGGSKLETHLPRTRWPLGKRYACFLSHYKAEAGSDARYIHDILQRVLGVPVFLDSVDLSNLTLLFTEGVHQSDVLVLLATRKVFSRPWCLLEIHEALEKGIPVVVVVVAGRGFDWARARDHLARLEETLPASALDEIREHVGDDIEPFKR